MKGTILLEVELPESCYCCSQTDESGRCVHTGLHVDHFTGTGRAPHCPIISMTRKQVAERLGKEQI